MKKEDQVNRVQQLKNTMDRALAEYHALLGRWNEATFVLEEWEKGDVVAAIEDGVKLVEEVA